MGPGVEDLAGRILEREENRRHTRLEKNVPEEVRNSGTPAE